MTQDLSFVTVITLNYNQNQYTIDCIESLLKSNYPNLKIFLIDNGSEINNYNKLIQGAPKDSRLNIIRLEKNIGYVGGVNHGLEKANESGAAYFLIMNNDTLIDVSAISALVATALRYDNNAIISGKVYNYDEKDTLQFIGNAKSTKGPLDFPSYIKHRREKDIGQYDQEMEMGMLDDIFWLIPKSVFEKVGYYSDYFFLYGEQNDYAIRAVKAGVKLIYTPNAKLWHKGSITTAKGAAYSPKVEYWGSFAVMKLAVLHFNEMESKKIFRNWVIRRFVKNLNLFLRGRSNFSIILAHVLAVVHFMFWREIRYKDNGYNPFS